MCSFCAYVRTCFGLSSSLIPPSRVIHTTIAYLLKLHHPVLCRRERDHCLLCTERYRASRNHLQRAMATTTTTTKRTGHISSSSNRCTDSFFWLACVYLLLSPFPLSSNPRSLQPKRESVNNGSRIRCTVFKHWTIAKE